MEKKKRNVVFEPVHGHMNEVLNWQHDPESEFQFFGDAYHKAAKDALAAALSNRSRNSIRFAPVVFLYRHALELNLKNVIILGNKILSLGGEPPASDDRTFTTHSLTHLMQAVERIYKYMGWTEGFAKGCIENFEDCKTVVNNLNDVDPQSYAFRYPIDKNGKGSVGKHLTFNIEIFAQRLDPVIELMSSLAYTLDHEYDLMCEAICGAQQAAIEYEHENGDYS